MSAAERDMPPMSDLGVLDGDVLIFGGPVGNLQATEAILEAATQHGIPGARIICTGDVAAYGADPEPTVQCLRAAGVHVVRGNCEDALGADAGDCGCNFESGSSCDALAGQWYAYTRAALSEETRAWMAARPPAIRFELAGRPLLAAHGAPSQINRWVFPSTSDQDKALEVALSGADGVVAGHAGIPFVETVQGYLWLNAGSVGLPANDGTPRGWYAIMSPDAEGRITVTLTSLAYAYEAAATRMRAVGLPEAYATCLETGRWPGEDVLPPHERAEAGQPIHDPQHLVWTRDMTATTAHAGKATACPCCG